MARSQSASTKKKKVAKEEPETKTQKAGKDACVKQKASKRIEVEVNTPQHENRSSARRWKGGSAQRADAGNVLVSKQKKTNAFVWSRNERILNFNCPLCSSSETEWKINETEWQIKTIVFMRLFYYFYCCYFCTTF